MKKTLILMAAASAFVLTGCTESDLSGDTSLAKGASSAIEFSAATRNAGTTRAGYAGDLTNTTIKEATAGFGVFAYYSGSQTIKNWGAWDVTSNPVVAINQAPNFMYNQEVKWGDNGLTSPGKVWNYSPVKYWPNGTDAANASGNPSNTATEQAAQYLSFFAYAPYVYAGADYGTNEFAGGDTPTGVGAAVWTGNTANPSAPGGVQNGIVAMSKNTDTKDMYVKYILNPAADANNKFVDLLWGLRGKGTYKETDNVDNTGAIGSAYNTDLTKQIVTDKVKFLFKHALSRVAGNTSKTSSSTTDKQVCGLKVVVDVDKNETANSSTASDHSNQKTYFSSDFDPAKTLVTIKSVKIRDKYSYAQEPSSILYSQKETVTSDFLTDGWFDIMNGKWVATTTVLAHTTNSKGVTYSVAADNTANTSTYNLNPDIKEVAVKNATGASNANWDKSKGSSDNGYTGGASGVDLTIKNVYAEDQDVPGLLLIPGEGSNTLYVTVDYVVRTADANLSTGYSEVEQIITNEVKLDGSVLKPNNYYSLIMHLGLTSVKFEAVVADWAETEGGTYDENGTETPVGETNKASVWLPSNVVSAATGNTVAAGNTITVNLASTATGGTVKITGMTAAAYTSSNTTVIADGTAVAGDNDLTITGLTPNYSNVPKLTTVKITQSPNVVTTINIVQAADNTFALSAGSPATINAAGSGAGVILISKNGEVSAQTVAGSGSTLTVTSGTAIDGHIPSVSVTSSNDNTSGENDIEYDVTLTITGSDTNTYTYYTKIKQTKD